MNARDRKNRVDETLDNLLLTTSELQEEIKQHAISSEQRIEELQKENQVLRKTLHEILDVSLRLRNHTPYSGQEVGIGNASGGFVLQIADEPVVRTIPIDLPSSALSSTATTTENAGSSHIQPEMNPSAPQSSNSKTSTPLHSSYDFHHEHHQLGHPQLDDYILLDQHTSLPSQEIKKN